MARESMIAEEFRIGGTCVIRGCVPKKLIVYASRFARRVSRRRGFRLERAGATRFDWPKLVAAKEKEITRLSGIYRANLEKAGVAIIESRAEVIDRSSRCGSADGREIARAHVILVATGGTAGAQPPCVEGREYAITSNEMFDLATISARLLVVGGGYIAVEFASIFPRLGAEGHDQRRAAKTFCAASTKTCAAACATRWFAPASTSISNHCRCGSKRPADGLRRRSLRGAETRRRPGPDRDRAGSPNTAGLGLEDAGVKLDRVGAIKVDAFSQSNVASIYAVGDVTNRLDADADRHPRGPCLRRHCVRRQADRRRARAMSRPPSSRRRRSARSASPSARRARSTISSIFTRRAFAR